MIATQIFCVLACALCGASLYYNKRDGAKAVRLLFLAYSMLAIGVIALLRRWGVV